MQGRRYIGVAVLGVSEQCCIIGVAESRGIDYGKTR